MSDKKPEKFRVTTPDGHQEEFEVAPYNIDESHPLISDLQVQLLRLRPGEQLTLPSNHFDEVTTDPSVVMFISELAILCGCSIKLDEKISDDPPIRGFIFTRGNHAHGRRTLRLY